MLLIAVMVARPGKLAGSATFARRAISIPTITRLAFAAVLVVAGFLAPWLPGGSALVYDTLVTIAILSASFGLDGGLSDLGEISLFHAAVFVAGAYAAAILTVSDGFNAWVARGAGVVAAALPLALVLGVITLRARAFAFPLVACAAPPSA